MRVPSIIPISVVDLFPKTNSNLNRNLSNRNLKSKQPKQPFNQYQICELAT